MQRNPLTAVVTAWASVSRWVCSDAAAKIEVRSLDEMVAHMRFLLGMIFGVLLVVVAAFIADSLATTEGAADAEPRQIVNWDVARAFSDQKASYPAVAK